MLFLGALGQVMYLDEDKFAEFTAYSCSDRCGST